MFFLLEFDWHQVSSNLQDSSQYSGRFHKCNSLDGLHSSSYFLLSPPVFFIHPLVTVTRAPTITGIIIPFMFHCFCQSSSKVHVLTFLFVFFNSTQWSTGKCFSFFSLDYYKVWSSGRDLVIRLYLLIPEYIVRIVHNRFWVVHISFICGVKFKLIAQFPVDQYAHPILSSLILFFSGLTCWFRLLYWLSISSLSSHNLHLLFCCILLIFALIWMVLIELFWAAIRRDSVSLLKFPFLSHVHVLLSSSS